MISLKELAEKKKDGEVADEKVKCKYSKFVFVGSVSIFTIAGGSYLYPTLTQS